MRPPGARRGRYGELSDTDRRFRVPNAAMCELFGYRREALTGRQSSALRRVLDR